MTYVRLALPLARRHLPLNHLHKLSVLEPFFKVRIVSILDLIVGASGDELGHLAPASVVFAVQPHDEQVLLERPLALDDVGRQVMVPALPALLANAPGQVHGDSRPVTRPVAPDNRRERLVFGLGPGCVGHVATVAQLEVPLVALNLRLAQQLADAAPGRFTQLSHQRQ